MLAKEYEKTSVDKILAEIEGTYAAFNKPPKLLPTIIRLYKKQGNSVKVTAYMAMCIAEGDRNLAQLCQQTSALARIDPPLLTKNDPPGYCSRN